MVSEIGKNAFFIVRHSNYITRFFLWVFFPQGKNEIFNTPFVIFIN